MTRIDPNRSLRRETLHARVQDTCLCDERGGFIAQGAIRSIRVIRIKQFVAAGATDLVTACAMGRPAAHVNRPTSGASPSRRRNSSSLVSVRRNRAGEAIARVGSRASLKQEKMIASCTAPENAALHSRPAASEKRRSLPDDRRARRETGRDMPRRGEILSQRGRVRRESQEGQNKRPPRRAALSTSSDKFSDRSVSFVLVGEPVRFTEHLQDLISLRRSHVDHRVEPEADRSPRPLRPVGHR
jgi:hypothetical protein